MHCCSNCLPGPIMGGQVEDSSSSSAISSSSFRWRSSAALFAYLMLAHATFIGFPSWQRSVLHVPTPTTNSVEPAGSAEWDPMAALVEPYGYQLQEHFVTTADGFILRMFRIPGRKTDPTGPEQACTSTIRSSLKRSSMHTNTPATCSPSTTTSTSSSSRQRPVVFLQHALMDSSAGWLILGTGRSLALQLVDAGFDVWMGNARGNRYSRNHTTLQPDQPAFWAWSWQQQAEYDLPASIGYVLEATQQQKLVYVGYSQGTMTALAALSTQPQLAASISGAILLAPVAFTTGMTSPSFVLSSRLGLDAYGLQNGWMEWGSHQPYWANVCRHMPQLCLHFLTAFCGKNPTGNVDPALIPTIFQHLPAGTSVQVMSHWAQGIRRRDNKHLYAFDYGTNCSNTSDGTDTSSLEHNSSHPMQQLLSLLPASFSNYAGSSLQASGNSSARKCNQRVYGQEVPPFYNMSAITTPLALFSGGQDTISTLADVELLQQQLLPGILQVHQHFPDYGHLDFELGSDAPILLYPTLLQLARRFSGTA